MSGKAPPTGPRALTGSLPTSAVPGPPTPRTPFSPANSSPQSTRVGLSPPTGHRDPGNGSNPSPYPSGQSHIVNGRPSHLDEYSVNDALLIGATPLSLQKGKQRETWFSQPEVNTPVCHLWFCA